MISALVILIGIFTAITLYSLRFRIVLNALLEHIALTDPEWFRRIDGQRFFSPDVHPCKEASLFHFILNDRHRTHQDPVIQHQCERLKKLARNVIYWLMTLLAAIWGVIFLVLSG